MSIKRVIQAAAPLASTAMAFKDIKPHLIISGVYMLMYALVLVMLFRGEIAVGESHMALVHTVVGILTAAQTQIINFWFGSSSGSKEKDHNKTNGVH